MNLQFTRSGQPPAPPPLHVILASQSVGRKTLLEKLGIRFRTVVSHVAEDTITHPDPYITLKRRATAKADEIIKHPRVYTIDENAKTLLITADSMAVVGKKTFGKASDRDDARTILKVLMDRTHVFATAVCVTFMLGLTVKKRWEKLVRTKVTLGKLKPAEIDSYVARYDFTRYAAGYALNDAPWNLVTKIDGSYTNVIGLPFEVLLPIFRELEIIV